MGTAGRGWFPDLHVIVDVLLQTLLMCHVQSRSPKHAYLITVMYLNRHCIIICVLFGGNGY